MLTGPGTTKGITYEKNQISNHFILIGSGPLKEKNNQGLKWDVSYFTLKKNKTTFMLHVLQLIPSIHKQMNIGNNYGTF